MTLLTLTGWSNLLRMGKKLRIVISFNYECDSDDTTEKAHGQNAYRTRHTNQH
ncbi:predicted protein [Histoplasma capsulatum H143]|uniref:Uncharacterized protein n=1 Tax=Ajellomyces capsulatus (strain H143) TaxID=544712 RepID=C6HSZ9_AJECH|nr:predicted protein [Histoplasma capsulatum H143]